MSIADVIAVLLPIFAFAFSTLQVLRTRVIARQTKKIAYLMANRPNLRLSSLVIERDKVSVFGAKKFWSTWEKKLPTDYLDILRKTSKSISIQYLDGEQYGLVNLCNENTPSDDILLILNALKVSFENDAVPIIELSVVEWYSIQNHKKSFSTDIKMNIILPLDNETISLIIAYACPSIIATSANLGSIVKLSSQDDKTPIVLYSNSHYTEETPELAKEIFSFTEIGFLIRCLTINNDTYEFTMSIENKKDSRDISHCITLGRTMFDQKTKNALHNEDLNIISLVNNNVDRNEMDYLFSPKERGFTKH